ncbi:ATP-binding protein [Collinsella ihumii]|uniref:ATP-binding protein n=1 Tax=Collinsella ihumii TaxID=1720204 RepID=UPI0025AB31C2|nr:ATP-binding protein [Collinsella ihumii]MDN0056588.1 ATP-binding protein [Collinsella ihumii]
MCELDARGFVWNARKVPTVSDPDAASRPDLVRRQFRPPVPTTVLSGGITYLHTRQVGDAAAQAARCHRQRLVGDLKRAAEKGALERRMRFHAHLSLLIVDEVGYLDVDKEGADLLFQLVSRRYERRSTIVTTNVGIGAWAKVFGGPVVAGAIADRLCHHCTVLKITGRSYRTKDLAPDRDAGSGA